MRGGNTSPRDGAEATPEQTNPVRTAGPIRGREKPKEIIVGFFNQVELMEVKGTKVMIASPHPLYRALTNPAVLMQTMPGLKQLQSQGLGTYAAEMEMGVASIRGRYHGILHIQETRPPEAYRLSLNGRGPAGTIQMVMEVGLEPQGSATALHYLGKASMEGKVAGLGQKLLDGVAHLVLTQFFSGIEEYLHGHPPS